MKIPGLTLIVVCLFITACEKNQIPVFDETLALDETSIHDIRHLDRSPGNLPFMANFYTDRNYDENGDGFCTEEPFTSFNYQVGEGTGTHLGNFDVTISFCGAGTLYANGTGIFVAANGDELHFLIPSDGEIGEILPYDHPVYELQFQTPFEFIGGTGRFSNASGSGITESYVDIFDEDGNFIPEHRTDHTWTGSLNLH